MLQHVLNDKVALIVGVQTDLCQSIALQMAKFGCRIAIGNDDRLASQRDEDNRKDKLNSNNNSSRNQQSRSIALVAGANKIIVDTIDAFGRLDFLILNVGAEKTLSIELTDELLRRAAPHLAASNGLVVNVTGVSSVRPLWLACSFATGVIDMIERHQQQKPNWLHSKTCLKSHYVSDTSVPGVRITSVGPSTILSIDSLLGGQEKDVVEEHDVDNLIDCVLMQSLECVDDRDFNNNIKQSPIKCNDKSEIVV